MEEWTIGMFAGQVQFLFIYFLIATLWNFLKLHVIKQIKKTVAWSAQNTNHKTQKLLVSVSPILN